MAPIRDPNNSPNMTGEAWKLNKTLKVLRIVYGVFLVPVTLFMAFELFIFVVAYTNKRLIDWAFFFSQFVILASMIAAIVSTGSLISSGKQRVALRLYLVPIALVGGLIFIASI
jgi:hypothetical protein